MRLRWIAVLLAVAGSLGAPAARAQGDSVKGNGTFRHPCDWDPDELCIGMVVSVDASSGPNGENPTGTAGFMTDAGGGGGVVTRLCVSGNTAIVVGEDPYAPGYWRYFSITVQDNTAKGEPDVVTLGRSDGPITECVTGYDFGPHPLTSGDIAVIDALTPSQQLDAQVPCSGPSGTGSAWKSHGQYMRSVAHAVNAMVEAGSLTEDEADALVSARARSGCGAP
jgi:hypothetical protein